MMEIFTPYESLAGRIPPPLGQRFFLRVGFRILLRPEGRTSKVFNGRGEVQ